MYYLRCKDCGIPIKKEYTKGRTPQKCTRCREIVKQRWRDKQKEK